MKIALIAFAILFAGCAPAPDTQMQKMRSSSSRFYVERIGVIEDDLAYNERRGIYIVTDKSTGKEYIGVSGIGISELGSHVIQSGKTTMIVTDER